MNDEKKVSVIIPHFNSGMTIERTIVSLINQTYKNLEIIIVDDCSTSKSSINECEKLANLYRNITLVRLENNGGVSNARNVGIDHASGDFITFVDSDDEYHEKKIENEVDILRNNPNSIIYSNVIIKNGKSEKKYFNRFNQFSGNIIKPVCNGLMPCPRDMMIELSILKKYKIKYDIKKKLYEDLDFALNLSSFFVFIPTYKIGTIYHQENLGLSKASKEKHIEVKKSIFSKHGIYPLITPFDAIPIINKIARLIFIIKTKVEKGD